jgi:hypothetical protein
MVRRRSAVRFREGAPAAPPRNLPTAEGVSTGERGGVAQGQSRRLIIAESVVRVHPPLPAGRPRGAPRGRLAFRPRAQLGGPERRLKSYDCEALSDLSRRGRGHRRFLPARPRPGAQAPNVFAPGAESRGGSPLRRGRGRSGHHPETSPTSSGDTDSGTCRRIRRAHAATACRPRARGSRYAGQAGPATPSDIRLCAASGHGRADRGRAGSLPRSDLRVRPASAHGLGAAAPAFQAARQSGAVGRARTPRYTGRPLFGERTLRGERWLRIGAST